MKKSFVKQVSHKRHFVIKKATALLMILAVVFVLVTPAKASAAGLSDLASGVLKSAFGGATNYAAGTMFNFLTGKLGSGFNSILEQKQRLQLLYDPAMNEFMKDMDKTWAPSLPGLFSALIFSQQSAFQLFVGSGEQQSFQEAGNYSGLVENAQSVSDYTLSQSAAQSTYDNAQETIGEATDSEATNLLGTDSKVAKDINATEEAIDLMKLSGGNSGSSGSGFWDTLGGIVGVVGSVLPFI